MANAAQKGHFFLLKWAIDNGCPFDESACANAADGGHPNVLKWLRGKGCSWDERVCANATLKERVDILH